MLGTYYNHGSRRRTTPPRATGVESLIFNQKGDSRDANFTYHAQRVASHDGTP